jgi:hypothetical protein
MISLLPFVRNAHIFLAVILVLDYATILHSYGTERHLALDQAQSQYLDFLHASTTSQFPAAFQHYSDTEFLQFILNNRLSLK